MSSADDDDPERVLRRYARRLNGRSWRWPFMQPFYDCLADALIWPDEKPFRSRSDLPSALRPLYFYRTGMILGEARSRVEFWDLGKRLFPDWVGFAPERCRPSRRRIAIYRAGNIATLRCLKELDWDMENAEDRTI